LLIDQIRTYQELSHEYKGKDKTFTDTDKDQTSKDHDEDLRLVLKESLMTTTRSRFNKKQRNKTKCKEKRCTGKERTRKNDVGEFNELESTEGKKNVYRVARQILSVMNFPHFTTLHL